MLTQQRILAVYATASTLDVTGEASAGYSPALGLRRFERRLTLDRGIVTIHETIEAPTPHIFTEVLHSDGDIRRGDGGFDLGPDGRGLRAEIAGPHDLRTDITDIEDNSVIAPGRPGSVDKGDLQKRGQRLLISTSQPVRSVVFDLRLAVQ